MLDDRLHGHLHHRRDDGVPLAVPPADFVLHNSLFLIAHFHNVIIGGVLFGVMAAVTYWYPKAFGYKLNEFWGKCSFLVHRVLLRVHAVCAGPDGRDPPHEPL
jgi:heme/copper-type cytochrome/quinol oxidase subunit 1